MRRVFLLALAVALLLSGCRGGGWVFKGFHKDQDRALLEQLGEKYPQMEFSCTGQSEGAVHQVLAGDGTQFPAWTAPGSKGKFQIIEHYLEEWLAAQGFYTALEEKLTELGFEWKYASYNHYDRHFEVCLGGLDSPDRLEEAAQAFVWAKERFDSLYGDFQVGAGCEDPLLSFNGSFTLTGEEHFQRIYLSMRQGDAWNQDYAYDDYRSVLRDAVKRSKEKEDIPDIES